MPRLTSLLTGMLLSCVLVLSVLLQALPAHADDGGAEPPPAPPSPVLVAFGDSVPAASFCDDPGFVDLLGERHGWQVDNHAVGGFTSQDVLDQLTDEDVAADVAGASTVLVMVGANDVSDALGDPELAGMQVDGVRERVTSLVQQLHELAPGAKVVLVGYWNISTDGAAATELGDERKAADVAMTARVNAALSDVAQQQSAVYVDSLPVFKGPDGAADPTGLLLEDGDHPNGAGHRALAEAVSNALDG